MTRKKLSKPIYTGNVVNFLEYKKSVTKTYRSNNPYHYHGNGKYLFELEKYEQAIEECNRAIKHKPDYSDVYLLLYIVRIILHPGLRCFCIIILQV